MMNRYIVVLKVPHVYGGDAEQLLVYSYELPSQTVATRRQGFGQAPQPTLPVLTVKGTNGGDEADDPRVHLATAVPGGTATTGSPVARG